MRAVRRALVPEQVQLRDIEHEFEPQRGLPEPLPADEQLLWQGSPDWRATARRVFHVKKLVVYFALLMAVRLAGLWAGDATAGEMALSVLWMAVLATTAIALLNLLAWLSARATMYTVTDKRVVMRVGIVLTLTFNVPFKHIAAAGLRLDSSGHGDIPLTLSGNNRIAWLHLWPHVRPWRLARPEPMLRCVPNGAAVARLLAEAWSRQTGIAASTQTAGVGPVQSQRAHTPGQQPALAGQ